jgi:hypothetical protein
MMPRKNLPTDAAEAAVLRPVAAAYRDAALAALAQSDDLNHAMREGRKAIDHSDNVRAAISRNAAAKAAATARVAELNSLLLTLDADLALADADAVINPARRKDADSMQARTSDVARELSDKQSEIERCARAAGVLVGEAVDADEKVIVARMRIDTAMAALRTELLAEYDSAVRRVCAELADVQAVQRAMSAACPGLWGETDLAAVRLVAPATANVEFDGLQWTARGDDLLSQTDAVFVPDGDDTSGTLARLRAHYRYTPPVEAQQNAMQQPGRLRSWTSGRRDLTVLRDPSAATQCK